MGCWNGSCALSGLPIFHHDKVYVYLLIGKVNADDRSHCSPSTYFYPLVYHFEAEYNDYGGIEEETGPLISKLVETVKDNLIEMEVGKNPCHDIAVKKEGFNLETLIEADHESRLFVEANYLGNVTVNHITIRKDVLDCLFATYGRERYMGTIDPHYQTFKYAEVLELCQAAAKQQYDAYENGERTAFRFNFIDVNNAGHGLRFLNEALNACRYQWILIPSCDLHDAAEARDYPLFSALIEHIVHHYWLDSIMHAARRSWVVPSGAGSQDDDTTAHEALAITTLATIDKLKNRFDDYE